MSTPEESFEAQSNAKLLETLLRSHGKAAMIAKTYSLEELADLTRPESKLTPAAYRRLRAAVELGRRVQEAKSTYGTLTKISSSSEAIAFCRQHFARLITDCMQEQFHMVTLTTKNKVIRTHHITTGTLDASLVHPREVFRVALRDAASSIILAHNHPSGDPRPSPEDHAVTGRLERAGDVVGITVLDHIVMAREGIISIREAH